MPFWRIYYPYQNAASAVVVAEEVLAAVVAVDSVAVGTSDFVVAVGNVVEVADVVVAIVPADIRASEETVVAVAGGNGVAVVFVHLWPG